MNNSLFKSSFFDKFVPHCCTLLRKIGLPAKVLLLLDKAPSHLSSKTLITEDQQIRCVFLSPNTTSHIQPMDQGVLQNIMMLYWRDLLMKAADREDEDVASFISLVNMLNIRDCVFMVSSAWDSVCSKSTIAISCGKEQKKLWQNQISHLWIGLRTKAFWQIREWSRIQLLNDWMVKLIMLMLVTICYLKIT